MIEGPEGDIATMIVEKIVQRKTEVRTIMLPYKSADSHTHEGEIDLSDTKVSILPDPV